MPERTPRLAYDNLLPAGSAVSSSADSAATVTSMLDPQPTKKWRSLPGWQVTAGFNDKLDFTRVTAKVAALTVGTYATPAAYATMVLAALEAIDPTPVWNVTYDATTRKFTVSADTGNAFSIDFAGPNATTSGWQDLGFTASRASALSQIGDVAAYQGRQWISWDLGAAKSFTYAAVYAHNFGSTGTVTLWASDTAHIHSVIDRDFSVVMAGDDLADKRVAFFATQAYRWVGVVIDNVSNVDGWVEIGHAFVGNYWQPSRSYAQGLTMRPLLLGTLIRTVEGGMYRGSRRMPLQIEIAFPRLPRADFDAFLVLLRESQDQHLYLALDPQNFPGSRTYYGVIATTRDVVETVGDGNPPDRYTIQFTFEEAPTT